MHPIQSHNLVATRALWLRQLLRRATLLSAACACLAFAVVMLPAQFTPIAIALVVIAGVFAGQFLDQAGFEGSTTSFSVRIDEDTHQQFEAVLAAAKRSYRAGAELDRWIASYCRHRRGLLCALGLYGMTALAHDRMADIIALVALLAVAVSQLRAKLEFEQWLRRPAAEFRARDNCLQGAP